MYHTLDLWTSYRRETILFLWKKCYRSAHVSMICPKSSISNCNSNRRKEEAINVGSCLWLESFRDECGIIVIAGRKWKPQKYERHANEWQANVPRKATMRIKLRENEEVHPICGQVDKNTILKANFFKTDIATNI